MKKKISIILIMFMIVFSFVPALTLAQDEIDDDQETVIEEDLMDEDEDSDIIEDEEMEEISDELKEVLEGDYTSVEEFLAALEDKELLTTVERTAFERKLNSYDENLSMETITSVVDKVLTKEIDLGQGFVILNNLEESIANGYSEKKAMELINSQQDLENSGQFAFQTALELRKLSREDSTGRMTEEFAEKINSILEEEGNIETSELKQLAAEYRKDAREENRNQMKAERSAKSNSASENAMENKKSNNNASENAVNKDDKGKGNSNNSKAKDKAKNKGNDNASDKSQKSNSKTNK